MKTADTTTLIHVQLAELVALETLRVWHNDTPQLVTRSVTIRQRVADTTASASTALRSDFSAEKTTTDTRTPLMATSEKGGVAWLCPIATIVLLLFFVIFFIVKRKFVKF